MGSTGRAREHGKGLRLSPEGSGNPWRAVDTSVGVDRNDPFTLHTGHRGSLEPP